MFRLAGPGRVCHETLAQPLFVTCAINTGAPSGSEAGNHLIVQIPRVVGSLGARKNVFVIGTTNRPDTSNTAVIYPGHLCQLIYILLPGLLS